MRPPKGRGAAENPPNRFEPLHIEADPDLPAGPEGEAPSPETLFFRDSSRSALSRNDSPDIPFTFSLNPYRGCEHGCSYCYARPTHEYLGFSAGLDFETRILVREDAPELLRRELASPSWKPQTVAMSGVTDPYQPVERRLGVTRRCLEVLESFMNPVAIVTKNRLVARDADILGRMASRSAAAVFLSVTTLDEGLRRAMEPRTSTARDRLAAVSALKAAGVPAGVMVAPVIPGLTDHEMPSILKAAAEAGAVFAGYVLLRLPLGVGPLFEAWLERHAPGRMRKVLSQVRQTRGGRTNDPRFGSRMRGEGPLAEQIRALFKLGMDKAGLSGRGPELSAASFRRPSPSNTSGPQLELFQP